MENFPELFADAELAIHRNGIVQSSSARAGADAGMDPFDPNRLRLAGDSDAALGLKKVLLAIPVKKPSKEWWVRAHPAPEYQVNTCLLELKERRETYLVDPELWSELAGETLIAPYSLTVAVNRQGTPFIWTIRLPDSTGRTSEWTRSALDALELAKRQWVRVQANMASGAYELTTVENLPDPVWPDLSLREILRLAFRDCYINSLEHPVLRELRGALS